MHIIFCNLDLQWEFSTLVHHHCLDVYADPRVEFWHIGAAGGVNRDCWGDWPRRIVREHLLAELVEAGEVRPATEPCLLLISAAVPDPGLERELAALVGQPGWRQGIQLWALAADEVTTSLFAAGPADPGGELCRVDSPPELEYATGTGTTRRYTVLLDPDPLRRLYSLRILGELFSQHDDRDNPLLPPGGVFRLSLEGRRQMPLSDCVRQHWPAMARSLLQAADDVQRPRLDTWRQAVEDTYRAVFKRLGAHPDRLQSRELLLDERLDDQSLPPGIAPESNELTEPARQLLQWPTPWFHDPRLPETMRRQWNAFTDTLDRTLTERCARLQQAQQSERIRQFSAEQDAHRADLTRCHAWTLGISEETLNQIKRDRAELDHYRAAIRRRVEKLTTFLRQRIESGVRRRAPVFGDSEYAYRRRWLAEDANSRDARREAKTAARHLAGRTAFWGGLAAIAGLALLPVLILRGPTLLDTGGVRRYFDNPTGWGMDAAWVLLFVLLYLGSAGYQIYRRHRRLRIAQDGLRNAAEALWRQNLGILDRLFHYHDHSQAQRLLTALDEHGERLLAELAQAQDDLNLLRRDLQGQSTYYQTLPPAPPPAAADPGMEFAALEGDALSPGQWLRCCLEPAHWRRLPAQSILVAGGRLQSRYLLGCEAITLRPLPLPTSRRQ
jgi:hypothetical protein